MTVEIASPYPLLIRKLKLLLSAHSRLKIKNEVTLLTQLGATNANFVKEETV